MRMRRSEAYEVLEIEEEEISASKIKSAYFTQARKWHPDKNPQNSHEAKVRFQKITAAYERLTDQAALSDSDDDDHAFFDEEDEEMMHRAADFFAYMEQVMTQRMRQRGFVPNQNMTFSIPMSEIVEFLDDDDDCSDEDDYDHYPHHTFRGPRNSISTEDLMTDPYFNQETSHTRRMSHEQKRREDKERFLKARSEARQAQRAKAERMASAPPPPKQGKAVKKAAAAKARKAEEERIRAANEAHKKAVAAYQPARPVIVSRTDTEIALNLAKRGSKLDEDDYTWELEYTASTGTKVPAVKEGQEPEVTVTGLIPGTKYEFKARRGLEIDEEMVMSQWSAMSAYPTSGDPPKAAAAPKEPVPVQKGRKKEKPKKEVKLQQQPVISPEEAERLLKEEKQREADAKKAIERAAQDYAQEAAKLAAVSETALKPGQQTKPKSKTTRAKSRKKQTSEDDFWAPVKVEPKVIAPADKPAMDAPTVKKINFHQASRFAPQTGEDYAHLDSNAMSEMERMQLEEAIQLSLALEESKKANQQAAYYAYQQGALNTDTDAFGGVIPKGKNNKEFVQADDWGNWAEEASPVESGVSTGTHEDMNAGNHASYQEPEDDGWGSSPAQPAMARPSWDQEHHKPEVTTTLNDWGSKQDSRDPVPSDDDEGWGQPSGESEWGPEPQGRTAADWASQAQNVQHNSWAASSKPPEPAPSNSVAPSQYQPYPQPQEQPKVAPATYQPYSAKPVYNPLKPIKKITVPTPAQASAQKHGQQLPEPFLPHDLDSPGHSNPLKPLPAAFRPGQQRHYTGTPSYQPQAETFRPQAEPYQPQPSRYNNGASFNQAPPNPAAAEFHPREPVQLPRWQPDQEQLSHPSLTARQEQGQQNQYAYLGAPYQQNGHTSHEHPKRQPCPFDERQREYPVQSAATKGTWASESGSDESETGWNPALNTNPSFGNAKAPAPAKNEGWKGAEAGWGSTSNGVSNTVNNGGTASAKDSWGHENPRVAESWGGGLQSQSRPPAKGWGDDADGFDSSAAPNQGSRSGGPNPKAEDSWGSQRQGWGAQPPQASTKASSQAKATQKPSAGKTASAAGWGATDAADDDDGWGTVEGGAAW